MRYLNSSVKNHFCRPSWKIYRSRLFSTRNTLAIESERLHIVKNNWYFQTCKHDFRQKNFIIPKTINSFIELRWIQKSDKLSKIKIFHTHSFPTIYLCSSWRLTLYMLWNIFNLISTEYHFVRLCGYVKNSIYVLRRLVHVFSNDWIETMYFAIPIAIACYIPWKIHDVRTNRFWIQQFVEFPIRKNMF